LIGQPGDAVPDSVKVMMADENPRVALSALILARTISAGTVREGYDKLIAIRFPSIAESVKNTPHPSMLLYAAKDVASVAASVIPAPVASAAPAKAVPAADSAGQFFQVGAYRNGANAEAVASKLKAIGVQAYTKHNPKRELFIVYVSAGTDSAKTVLTLKDAGYEAWPLEAAP
jgi:cell division septation protein DedD